MSATPTSAAPVAAEVPGLRAAAQHLLDAVDGSDLRASGGATNRSAIVNAAEGLRAALAAQPADLPAVIEQIAQQWDGCEYDGTQDEPDIGKCIRAAGKRLLAAQPAAQPAQQRSTWPIDPLDLVQVVMPDGSHRMLKPCFAYFDAASMSELDDKLQAARKARRKRDRAAIADASAPAAGQPAQPAAEPVAELVRQHSVEHVTWWADALEREAASQLEPQAGNGPVVIGMLRAYAAMLACGAPAAGQAAPTPIPMTLERSDGSTETISYQPMSDAEFLSRRLTRLAAVVGYPMPKGSHEFIAGVAGTILGGIALKLEQAAAAPAQAQALTYARIAEHIADTWPDQKYTLAEIEARLMDLHNVTAPTGAAPTAAPQYRLLIEGDTLQAGDEMLTPAATWAPLPRDWIDLMWEDAPGPVRRKIDGAAPTGAAGEPDDFLEREQRDLAAFDAALDWQSDEQKGANHG